MADSLTSTLLQKLGVRMPTAPDLTPEQEQLRQEMIQRETSRPPQGVLENVHDFLGGLFYDPTQPVPEGKGAAYGLGAMGAALPFAPKGIKGMYSRVEKLAEQLPDLIKPGYLKGLLANRPPNPKVFPWSGPLGSSQQELDWRKVPEFLEDALRTQKPVAKADFVKHLEENPLDVRVIEKGGPSGVKEFGPVGSNYGTTTFDPDTAATIPNFEIRDHISPTTYHGRYEMPGSIPGSYRETLIQLAKPRGEDAFDANGIRKSMTPNFQDIHWDEPDVVVGTRWNERVLPEHLPAGVNAADVTSFSSSAPRGRMLENVQSGWEQRGAHGGYGGTYSPGSLIAAEDEARYNYARTVNEIQRQFPEHLVADELNRLDHPNETFEYISDRLGTITNSADQIVAHEAIQRLQQSRVAFDNAIDAVYRQGGAVPDMPFKGMSTPPRLAIRQQLLDIAHNYPDTQWIGIAPYSELSARGERMMRTKKLPDGTEIKVENPEFQNVILPNIISEELKPFGGMVDRDVPLFERPAIVRGLLGEQMVMRTVDSARDIPDQPIAQVWPRTRPNAGVWPDRLTESDDVRLQDLVNLIRQTNPSATAPQRVTSPGVARLTPEMLAQIREKGFPLALIMAMLQAQQETK